MNRHRNKAVDLLQHYLRRATEGNGGKWGDDHDAEVAEIVDCIVDAAYAEALEARQSPPVTANVPLCACGHTRADHESGGQCNPSEHFRCDCERYDGRPVSVWPNK